MRSWPRRESRHFRLPMRRRAPERSRGTASDLLVSVWQLLAAGQPNKAREKLLLVWSNYMDGFTSEQEGRVALRLFERLAPSTDDPRAWKRLPDVLPVHRAGEDGVAWSISRASVDGLAATHDLSPTRSGTVSKSDVLAYITWRGEEEVVLRPGSVR